MFKQCRLVQFSWYSQSFIFSILDLYYLVFFPAFFSQHEDFFPSFFTFFSLHSFLYKVVITLSELYTIMKTTPTHLMALTFNTPISLTITVCNLPVPMYEYVNRDTKNRKCKMAFLCTFHLLTLFIVRVNLRMQLFSYSLQVTRIQCSR